MGIQFALNKGRVPVKVWTRDIEPEAIRQLLNVAALPIVRSHIAAMPDVHAGKGATVGSVIPTLRAIIPAAVGVDIGCGMHAVRTSLTAGDLPDSLRGLRSSIEEAVPVGFKQHAASRMRGSALQRVGRGLGDRLDVIVGKHPGLLKMQRRFSETWLCQIGTLGGGNHFIELCLDELERVWIMLHSGSRGIGNVLGRYFIAAAQKDMQRHQVQLPDRDLAYLAEGSTLFADYVAAVEWAQDYSRLNRDRMMAAIVEALRPQLPPFRKR
jgi:tRNA-splicing ligase RtcB